MEFELEQLRKKFILLRVIIIILLLCVCLSSVYALLFLLCGLIPTMIAFVVDDRNNKFSSATVFALNMVGLLPYLSIIWRTHDISASSKLMLGNFEAWCYIIFLSLMGKLMILFVPELISIVYMAKAKIHIEKLEQDKHALCNEWSINSD